MSEGHVAPASRQQSDHSTRNVNIELSGAPEVHNSTYSDPNTNPRNGSSFSEQLRQSADSYPQWNANYIPPATSSKGRRPSSPSEVAAGARSPEDLLRRLSLATQRPTHSEITGPNPRTTYPGLELSGNVISATFCVPYRISHGSSGKWVRTKASRAIVFVLISK